MVTIAIVIPSLGRPSLDGLLASIPLEATSGSFASHGISIRKIVAFDSNVDAERMDIVRAKWPEIQIVRAVSPGVNCARNAGAEAALAANSEVVWFLDDDVEVLSGDAFFAIRESFFRGDDGAVNAAGGNYISDHESSIAENGYNSLCSLWRHASGDEKGEFLLGGTLAVRTSWWKQVGGFDETIIYGGAESSFVARLRDLGARPVYLKELDVIHRPAARGFDRWMDLAYRQGAQKTKDGLKVPSTKTRATRSFDFLTKQEPAAIRSLVIFGIPFLAASKTAQFITKRRTSK